MIQPFIHGKPSHPSQLSRSGVEPACEGLCDGFDNEKNLHSVFEASCEGVTVVKVFHGIKGEKRFCLMTAIVERKAPDIDYRKHGLRMVGLPPQGLIRGALKSAHS